jgi:hypothetical protein
LRSAAAAWKIRAPEAGTAKVSNSSLALAFGYGVAERLPELLETSTRRRGVLAGLPRTADADRNAEMGSGSTPRNSAGSIATDTAARPSPARSWVSRPPNECPITTGLLFSLPMTAA